LASSILLKYGKPKETADILLLLLLLLCWALSCYFKVLSWRLSFSCYRQSVVVVENFFLSCGLPSKCVVVVENEFLSLLWVTYLPMICFQRFQLSSIWYTDVGSMNNLTTNALWIAHLLLELDFPECNWLLGFLEYECCFVIMLQVIGEGSALHFLQLDASQVGFTFSAVAS
jgi:hypothetical protein